MTRLRCPREQLEQVEALIDNHMRFKDVSRMKESTLKRFLRLPEFEEHLELHRLDGMSSSKRLDNYQLAKAKFEEYTAEHLQPEPLVTGADLIGMGYEPGPQFSQILAMVEDAQLEGRIRSQDEAMDWCARDFPGRAKLPHPSAGSSSVRGQRLPTCCERTFLWGSF